MGNGWSECFNKALRAYFDDGIVPEKGTVCADTTCRPFFKNGTCEAPPQLREAAVETKTDLGNIRYMPLGLPF